ncbi:hypothetical protein BX666DRAFT_1882051 [Dichotomocladium elegans]|nr:hypothetical protein BX666DRAFT_1882051 [Dichotomocladium elegans]
MTLVLVYACTTVFVVVSVIACPVLTIRLVRKPNSSADVFRSKGCSVRPPIPHQSFTYANGTKRSTAASDKPTLSAALDCPATADCSEAENLVQNGVRKTEKSVMNQKYYRKLVNAT